jgi:rhodanese-related sulfurtransferase
MGMPLVDEYKEWKLAGSEAAVLDRIGAERLDRVGEAVYASVVGSLRAFRDESRAADWAECVVLVCGPPFGRRDSIEIAAGMEVLGRETLGTRLLYMDNVFTIPDAVSQLGGIVADREIVTYCHSGVRAAHTYALLRAIGYPRVRLYDGSWLEWSTLHGAHA